ncbi:restriction endonuclease subunit S [Enterococcus sp. N342-3-1-2]
MGEKKAPKLRFDGFDQDWEQRKLGNLAAFSKGNGYTKNDLQESGDPIVLYGRLYTKYETVINDVDTFVIKKEKSVISEGNEVIVPASGESAKDISRASVIDTAGLILGGDLNIIRPNVNINPIFLALTISNGSQQREMSKRAQGKSVVHLHNSDLKEVNLLYTSLKEQKKIGTFFKQLDDTIALHQRKLEQLKLLKQAFLQKMFVNQGNVPELRFADFSEEWEQRKLGDLGTVAMNKRIFKKETSERGDIPFYKIGTFGSAPDAFISKKLFDEYRNKYPYPKEGDLLISASGSIGRIVEYTGADEYFQDSNIVWLKHDNRLIDSFLKQFYSVVKWQGLEGSTIKRLYNKNILETEIVLPNPMEQQKIGTFFKQLDDTIALHKNKVYNLKQLKESFLQRMFI